MNPRTWYGVRRLYEARFRERVLLMLVVVAAGYYLTWSVVQWVTLTPAALRFDFVNYFGGAQAAAHGTDIYADFKRSWGSEAWVVAYIYPPFFALLLAPLTSLGLLAAARIWLLVVHAAFLVALALILRIHPELSRSGRRLFLLAGFTFMPVYLNLKFQQVATVWLLLITAALWAALRRRSGLAGAFIAAAASLKVTPIFLIPLFARLGRWRVAVLGAVMLVGVTVVSLLAAPGSWQFFTVVLPRIGLGTANWDNGSIDGLVSRIVELAPGLFGGATQTVAKVTIAAAAVIVIGITLWVARDRGVAPREPRFSAMRAFETSAEQTWPVRLGVAALVTSLLIVSSVTWQHHLVTLLLPMATAIAWIAVRRPGARYGWGVAAAYAMCWVDRRAFPLPADLQVHTPGQAALVLAATSVKLAGLLLLWLLLLRMLRHEERIAVRVPEHPVTGAMAQPAA
ncbi:MAG TPA: glycosyltransferase family 87 protein [Candidatus Dormibacteraeota bacterium]|nr:glycosyltransferase family 87 protein [Candidatus Dormibacteraeota bacterium]